MNMTRAFLTCAADYTAIALVIQNLSAMDSTMPAHDSSSDEPSWLPAAADGDVASELARLMERDLVFVMKFLGESQYRLQSHFQDFILAELAKSGIGRDTHPMISGFAETHALLMRDFVFAGVALTRQFRAAEMERLLGDTTAILRVDVWDQLRRHIEAAEAQFRRQIPHLEERLEAYRPPDREGSP